MPSVFRKIFLCFFILLLGLIAIALIRTAANVRRLPKDVCNEENPAHGFLHDEDYNFSTRLSKALTFKTISWSKNNIDLIEIGKFIEFIKKSFPTIHSSPFVQREIISNASLLYTIKGSDPYLKPFLLAGHLDVVPVDVTHWIVPPFDGIIKDGYIYGRGAIDAKDIVMGIMEAFEVLLKKGYRPKRSFYIAFGHDEEVFGNNGAAQIAEVLKSRNVKLEYILDEGLVPVIGGVLGVKVPVVNIGVTEKGFLTLNVTVRDTPGHSSMPKGDSAIVALSRVLSKFHYKVHPNMFGYGLEKVFFESVAPYASFWYSLSYSNIWLFSPIISWIMTLKPHTHALVRTSTSVTMISGGVKENVLPSSASAIINHRIHPAQTVDEVVKFDRDLINDDNVEIQIMSFFEPHPISPYDEACFGYNIIKKTSNQLFPNSPVVPGVLMGNTDTRWYLQLTDAVYRFSPALLSMEDVKRIHGNNEQISIKSYEKMVNFYYHLLLNSDAKEIDRPHGHEEL